MEKNQKLFAFKLADKNTKNEEKNKAAWKAREGVVVAGCTSSGPFHCPVPRYSGDRGAYC